MGTNDKCYRIISLIALLVGLNAAQAAEFSITRSYVKPLLQQVERSVVSSGSLVVIQPGYALTAYHSVAAAEAGAVTLIALTLEGPAPVEIAATAPAYDLALVRSDKLVCPCAPIGRKPAQDDVVVAVGFPKIQLIRQQWLTTGLVQNVRVGVIQHTAWATGGSSGGGLFARQSGQWALVGINRAILTIEVRGLDGTTGYQELNTVVYAVDASLIREFLGTVKELTQ